MSALCGCLSQCDFQSGQVSVSVMSKSSDSARHWVILEQGVVYSKPLARWSDQEESMKRSEGSHHSLDQQYLLP